LPLADLRPIITGMLRKPRHTLTTTERQERERHRRAQTRERTRAYRARQAARRIPRTEELALCLLGVFLTSKSNEETIADLTRRFERALLADRVDTESVNQRLKKLRRRLLFDKA
jgi:hypothetical protein